MSAFRYFLADEISALVSLRELRRLMRDVLSSSDEDTLSPARFAFGDEARLGVMAEAGGRKFSLNAVKVVSLVPGGGHEGALIAFDRATGRLMGGFDAGEITALRTAAASAAVTEALMGDEVPIIGIIGTGRQAAAHIAAFADLFPRARFLVAGSSPDRAGEFLKRLPPSLCGKTGILGISDVFAQAPVICTLTSSRVPLPFPERLPIRVHINAVGSCLPTHRELPGELVAKATRFVDSLARAEREAGDLVLAKSEGHLCGDVGMPVRELLQRPEKYRRETGVTLFKSLGLPAEDLALAELILSRVKVQEGKHHALSHSAH